MKRIRSNFTLFFPFFPIILNRPVPEESDLFVIDHLNNQVIDSSGNSVFMIEKGV